MKYTVKSNIKMNGKRYEPGNEIELSEELAEELAHALVQPEEEAVTEPEDTGTEGAGNDEEPRVPVVVEPPSSPPGKEEDAKPPEADQQLPGSFGPGDPIRVETKEFDETAVVALTDFQRNNGDFKKDEALRVNTSAVESLVKKGKVRLATLAEIPTPDVFHKLRRADSK